MIGLKAGQRFRISNVLMSAAVGEIEKEVAVTKSNGTRLPTAQAIVDQIRNQMGDAWLGAIYRERILTLRTRSNKLFAAATGVPVVVQHTLLGIELKVGRRRKSCPDLATARYLSVFARAGVGEVAIPYDITKISRLADDLESSWQRMLLLAAHRTEDRSLAFRRRVTAASIRAARDEIVEAGPGTAVPEFNQNTSQRRRRRAW